MKTESELTRKVGAQIAESRKARKMTQTDLACAIGVSRISVTTMETGGQNINVAQLERISAIFKVSPVVFFDPLLMVDEWQ